MSSIIEVKNLSKSYTISHEGKEKYTTLRDVVTKKAKKLFSFPNSLKSQNNVTKEEFWALKNIDFDIKQGDRIGIIGRNGAGKSTLLKILSRIVEPTTGSIKIKGRVASLLEVGTGFHPELTGRENIFLNGAILGMSRVEIKKHFDAIVDFAETEKFLDTPVKRYSSGMYVRLAFAVAAHLEPEILVVDEVLAVGDTEFQKKCLGKMNEVSKGEGRTVLFVSHNMGVVSQLCNVGLLLHKGKIVANENIQTIIDRYSTVEANSLDSYNNENPKEFEITKVNILNKNNDQVFTHSEQVPVKISMYAPNKINGLHIGVALNDKWKRKVFTSQYKLVDDDYASQIITKELLIPSHLLLSGNFSVDVATFIPNSTAYSYLQDICNFQIEDFESEMSVYTADVGIINVCCQWD
jgi:lipopolysaccharide transport system ATP-binding protein